MKKSIIWLASYPKSGNTWTRIFLANYLANPEKPLAINEAHRFCMGDTIAKTYRMVAGRPVDTRDLDGILALRPRVLRGIVANNADVNFVKTHNLNVAVGAQHVELIPREMTRSAIYIMRNPLDMVLSYARHYGMDHATAVEHVCRDDNANAPDDETVAQYLGSWSTHVRSWTENSRFPTLVLRYEDMLADPQGEFTKVLEHIGIPVDAARLDRAVGFASFKELAKQEETSGFVEKSAQSERFFARGEKDQWRTELDPDLVTKMRRIHKKTMKKHGYW
ncbi:sulfotransferase domain-containing protein [Roseovarius sp. SCSIO 43702]|uniref:sulfotransferase domain-containing protein n=1 Tax=Roseovarius sp. SCSIO 43702 TaxID=2823043 RepID=UPI001C73B93F|nr:sulfotransferase domain-containing protein [Roseovarius sp. SCSIO 43702]QYX56215.1 sulfotransferase domain-containing protein [Roseovarius sp. SCSIO 43702]